MEDNNPYGDEDMLLNENNGDNDGMLVQDVNSGNGDDNYFYQWSSIFYLQSRDRMKIIEVYDLSHVF